MKRYLIILTIFSVYACSNSQHDQNKQQSYQENKIGDNVINKELKFSEINGQAVLIGEKIDLLDNGLKTIKDISNLIGKIVNLVGVSDSLFNKSNDICDSFWYVKIRNANKEGIVNGREVFKIQDSNQGTSFTVGGNQIEILTTKFFGMGVDYQGDLVGCPVNQPILIKDKKHDFFGLVNLIPNKYSKNATWNNEYPFFELRNDDGACDRIVSITTKGTNIKLKIHRIFQEGENDYNVLLTFENDKYVAKYLNFGKIKYE